MNAHRSTWMDPADYTQCQSVADAAREEHMQAICYASVRDLQHRLNYAVLTPLAFASPAPVAFQSWRIFLRADGALAKCEMPDIGMTFRRRDFDVESRFRTAGRRLGG